MNSRGNNLDQFKTPSEGFSKTHVYLISLHFFIFFLVCLKMWVKQVVEQPLCKIGVICLRCKFPHSIMIIKPFLLCFRMFSKVKNEPQGVSSQRVCEVFSNKWTFHDNLPKQLLNGPSGRAVCLDCCFQNQLNCEPQLCLQRQKQPGHC